MSKFNGKELFENLFVLELANNHWGSLKRGLQIIKHHSSIVKYNNVKAAIKLQFRDVDEFVHPDFRGNRDLRYVSKTEATKLSRSDFAILVKEIKSRGCIPMATPFDEVSVDLCTEFDMPIIKIASSDVNDWPLIERIARTKKPTIVSSGGASEKSLDDIVEFFANRNIPLAVNHCVSLYPCEDSDLYLDQIDYLKQRYPDNVIGLSTHEYHDWSSSMLISYSKGARTWERHIDIELDDVAVSPYCSLPSQCDEWFKAFHKAIEMCGGVSDRRRTISEKEMRYLDALVRGVYARHDLPEGHVVEHETFDRDFYLAIPLLKGQLSCREILNGETLLHPLSANQPLKITDIDGPCHQVSRLVEIIGQRGL